MRYENDRLGALEQKLDELIERVERLELRTGLAARPRQPAAPPPPPPAAERPVEAQPATAEPARPSVPAVDWEDLLGGRVLAWIGGAAIVLAVVLFLGMAISRGWIDEPTRVVLAFLGSTALLGAGVWLYERRGQTEAALAAVASAIAGLYATLVVATQVYDLVSPELGLLAAAVVGAVATAIAVRWESTVVGAIGILGALAAPILVDAGSSGASLMFMALALASAVGVLLWQRWDWLAVGAFVVSLPQLLAWMEDTYEEQLGLTLGVLVGFWALYAGAAIGYELRIGAPDRLPVSSWLLLLADVLLLAGGGYFVLEDTGHGDLAIAWLVGVAAGHIGLGFFTFRQTVNREIGSLLIGAGLTLSAIAFADALGGPVLVAGWAVHALVLAWLASRASEDDAPRGTNAERLAAASIVYLSLAVGHVLLFEAPPTALRSGVDDLPSALVALAIVAATAFLLSQLLPRARPEWNAAPWTEGLAAAAAVYLVSIAIVDLWGSTEAGEPRQEGQVLLSAFWALTGFASVLYGLIRDDVRFRIGGLALLAITIAKVFIYDLAELEAIFRVLSFLALGLLLLAGAFAYQRIRLSVRERARSASP
jgi:uncharacterized membrane protein